MLEKRALLLFSKTSVAHGQADPQRLTQLIKEADPQIDAAYAYFEDLLFYLDEQDVQVIDTVSGRPLTDYQVIYFRYWGNANVQGLALAAARFCKIRNIPFVDSEVLCTGSFNKTTQYMNLHEAGVPFPKTLIAPAAALLGKHAGFGFTFPLILKSTSGTRGQDNFLVKDEAGMRQVLEAHPTLTFVLQTCIPNNGDYRVVVMGDEVVLVIKRMASSDTHLNNTSQGGSAQLLSVTDLPQEVLDMSVRAAAFYGREIAGVDMVESTSDGRWYCFEVNRAPQIEHASFETEKAAALARYLQSLAR